MYLWPSVYDSNVKALPCPRCGLHCKRKTKRSIYLRCTPDMCLWKHKIVFTPNSTRSVTHERFKLNLRVVDTTNVVFKGAKGGLAPEVLKKPPNRLWLVQFGSDGVIFFQDFSFICTINLNTSLDTT